MNTVTQNNTLEDNQTFVELNDEYFILGDILIG